MESSGGRIPGQFGGEAGPEMRPPPLPLQRRAESCGAAIHAKPKAKVAMKLLGAEAASPPASWPRAKEAALSSLAFWPPLLPGA